MYSEPALVIEVILEAARNLWRGQRWLFL